MSGISSFLSNESSGTVQSGQPPKAHIELFYGVTTGTSRILAKHIKGWIKLVTFYLSLPNAKPFEEGFN